MRKTFGPVVAVADIDLVIDDGEFFSLLGPSGSGKTTVLRMIAGFERPDSGSVLLGGRDVTSLAPYDRDVNTVFQDYTLFPHMTVQENVEYGLRVKGIGRADRRRRAAAMLDTVRLGEYGARRPNQLSGGQRQRVALARALVNHPRVLLLDEPLGALDLKFREEMQIELRTIQREVGVTFVFVTHDQGEALSMSTRVAVFNAGRLEQVGTPQEIYDHPATAFVAGFVGASNLIDDAMSQRILGGPGPHVIRPERIRVSSASPTRSRPAMSSCRARCPTCCTSAPSAGSASTSVRSFRCWSACRARISPISPSVPRSARVAAFCRLRAGRERRCGTRRDRSKP